MLQQTTTQVVIPYYERFLKKFPRLKNLAKASQDEVFGLWSGLGYYSRAKNLHKAAIALDLNGGFPQSFKELLHYPGFGPYTSRSVASLAFNESVGVLDGNVIRVLSRVHDLDLEWWKTEARNQLQDLADQWVKDFKSSQMNQALMELGATICTPRSPSCLLCPLKSSCLARKHQTIPLRPMIRAKKEKLKILWQVKAIVKAGKIYLNENHQYPILKSHPLPFGSMSEIKKKPQKFHFKHSITHHEIFVHIDSTQKRSKADQGVWVALEDLIRKSPSSLVRKVVSNLGAKTD